ncbi:MAG: dihydrolipoamide acetyltransferase family protein [Solirubrobacteraceae bacterium]|jgi:pyruvate dehydrogenase E2 component (dihydrolipoamide acetyltransferase)
MAEIVMPRLSDTMEEGTILRWLKADGEDVARGEELVEIETDKATMTYESDQAGVLEIVAGEGSTLPVGEVIARVGAAAARTDDGPASGGPASERSDRDAAAASGTSAAATSAEPAGEALSGAPAGERVKASPLARRIAGERGVDLRALTGSGPGGRIVKADVLAPAAASTSSAAPVAGIEGVMTAKGETTTVELSRTQQTIARRMAESKATIPDFTLQIDVDMEECVKLRAQLKQLSHHENGPEPGAPDAPRREQLKAPTYNDMVVKASALALREHPTANGSYRDGRLQLHSRVNVGVAVAAENALVVPTVFDADSKSLGEIARETHTLVERVRTAAITPPELGGGTFTVSNLGMYGIESFTAIINPPQAGILSVGALAPRAVVREGQIVTRNTMTLILACDHRILYGAEAAQFLARIRELLEAPTALTL